MNSVTQAREVEVSRHAPRNLGSVAQSYRILGFENNLRSHFNVARGRLIIPRLKLPAFRSLARTLGAYSGATVFLNSDCLYGNVVVPAHKGGVDVCSIPYIPIITLFSLPHPHSALVRILIRLRGALESGDIRIPVAL